MPLIRIEWVPVKLLGLGFLGFDHLQLVYQQSAADFRQDEWFVMEGVREEDAKGVYLGIEGADGRTRMAVANLAARDDLIAKVGTPEERGSRLLSYGRDEFQAWESMASYAREIEAQDFPYVAYGPPSSPMPTINSSSALASLIHYSGLDPSLQLPFGVHLSPGFATLLGTPSDDTMRIEHGFTTLLGDHGQDAFEGGFALHRTEKFYGGVGDDLFRWSKGFNIMHGAQSGLDYVSDGTDVVDYSGAGVVTITLNRHWVPHKVPTYVAKFENGTDHLYSVERIQWNDTSDEIVLGKGINLIEDDTTLRLDAQRRSDGSNHLHSQSIVSGRLIDPTDDDQIIRTSVGGALPDGARHLELISTAVNGQGNALANRIIGNNADNKLVGLAGGDTLYGGNGNDILIGGRGSDGYVYLPGEGNDVIVDEGPSTDTDELILAGGITPEQISFHELTDAPNDLMLRIAPGGCIVLKDIFRTPGASIERIVFDHAPAWTREKLLRFAAITPVLRDEPLPTDTGKTQTLESVSTAAPMRAPQARLRADHLTSTGRGT